MSTSTIDYDALARQAGAVNVQPATPSTQSTQAAPQPNPAGPTGPTGPVDYDALARQAGAVDVPQLASAATPEGEIKNDVGNTVIVPKEDESFADTMKRAAAQGRKTTPEQVNAELSTAPGKAATVLAAAPVIGAAGVTAAMTPEALGMAKNAILKHLAEQSPELFGHEAVKETLKNYAMEGAKKALTGAAWAGGAEFLHSIWDDVFGRKR